MMDGANGPEIDSDAEDEDDGNGLGGEDDAVEGCNVGSMTSGPGLGLEGAEGLSSDNEEDAPKSEDRNLRA
jgi:hypothetical protein